MRKILLIISCCLFFILGACSSLTNKPLPTSSAHVENSNITIPVKIFSYRWGTKSEYGESAAIDVNIEPATIQPNSKITFSFDPKPKSIGDVHEVLNQNDAKVLGNASDGLLVPYTDGVHTYTYRAEWREGVVAFVFKVKVK
ncbi:hypothetical protein [Paenibacillus elgii]|uniref:hypothetical protein n=1 Tax=Paenibacillus elgii TaxID=189691 RepID=UPI000248C65C|nr:hypothetical protein [Paenibacillus elgii]